MGAPPTELISTTTTAHSHLGPRIWLAGRRLRSMSAATLRGTSNAAPATMSLRARGDRSLHCRLAAMASSSGYIGGPNAPDLTAAPVGRLMFCGDTKTMGQ